MAAIQKPINPNQQDQKTTDVNPSDNQYNDDDDVLDMTLIHPDQHQTPKGPPLNNNNNNNTTILDQKQKEQIQYNDKNTIINNCSVLIIPLDNRVTPIMVAQKFIKYGKILQVRPIKKSSSCIVIFSKPNEASNCIRLFKSHDKVRVTRPNAQDWAQCGDSVATKSMLSNLIITNPSLATAKEEKKKDDDIYLNKIKNYEVQQSRISIMYRQRHAYQMLFENDEIETKKRSKNNKLMINRIRVMYKTSEELNKYLNSIINADILYEENINKLITTTFGSTENGGSVHSAGIAIAALLKNRYEQFNDINNRVFKNILISSKKYENKLKLQKEYFVNYTHKLNNKIEINKTKMIYEWNKYQNILNRTLKEQQLNQHSNDYDIDKKNKKNKNKTPNKSGTASSSVAVTVQKQKPKPKPKPVAAQSTQSATSVIETDPFLVGKSYDSAQKEYSQSLDKYNSEMSKLFNNLIIQDKKRIDGIKSILIDYFLAEKAKAMNHVKLIESSLEYIKCIDKDHDTQDFIKRFINVQKQTQIIPINTNIQIKKQQQQQQQLQLKNKKNIKYKYTKSGGKQIIKNKLKHSVSTPIIPNNKQIGYINNNLEGYNISELFTFNSSCTFLSSSRELSSLIYTDIVRFGKLYRPGRIISSNWKPLHANITKFGFFHCFDNKNELKTTISINLYNTQIKIRDNNRNNSYYTFEIIVPNSSWFSLTGTPTKYLFKVNTQKELIDWIKNLKKFTN